MKNIVFFVILAYKKYKEFTMKQLFILILIPFYLFSQDYSKNWEAKEFVYKMHKKYGFNKQYLLNLLKAAHHRQDVLDRYNGHLKNATDYSWHRYKNKILIPQSIELGKDFMQKYALYLNRAKKRFGINKEIITAFIRVESKFGLYGGEYSVWDVLVTLAFNKNRKQRFFRQQLEKALLLAKREHLNVLNLKGSFAGAMGCVQQVPSIYLKYGVDLNYDGKKDPNSMADCIGSIAKFLRLNGWSNNRATIAKPKVIGDGFLSLRSGYRSYYSYNTLTNYGIIPPSWWRGGAYFIRLKDKNFYDIYLGDKNYRVITKYNASKQYATSIALYAKALK